MSPARPDALTVDTTQGPARAHVHVPDGEQVPVGTLLLGHGAGGGVNAPDLMASVAAGTAQGWKVLLVEQPWKVAGRRVAVAPPRLDEAWLEVIEALRGAGELTGPVVVRRIEALAEFRRCGVLLSEVE